MHHHYQQLCDDILKSHDNIIGVWVFNMKSELACSLKPQFPKPKPDDQRRMFLQAEIMLSIVASNEGLYGKARYVMASFDTFDAYMFPFEEGKILSLGCRKPYPPEQVISTVNSRVAQRVTE